MGYGNLGRGIECAIRQNADMELVAVFTRRDPKSLHIQTPGVPVYAAEDAVKMADKIDVLLLCGGSATDLPKQTPEYAKYFNVSGQLRHPCKNSGAFCQCRCSSERERPCGAHFRRLGSGPVLPEPSVCQCHPAGGQGLYVLGQGRQPGTFRCNPPDHRVSRMPRQYTIPVEKALEAVTKRRESGSDHPRKTYQRVLCCGWRRAQTWQPSKKRS